MLYQNCRIQGRGENIRFLLKTNDLWINGEEIKEIWF